MRLVMCDIGIYKSVFSIQYLPLMFDININIVIMKLFMYFKL